MEFFKGKLFKFGRREENSRLSIRCKEGYVLNGILINVIVREFNSWKEMGPFIYGPRWVAVTESWWICSNVCRVSSIGIATGSWIDTVFKLARTWVGGIMWTSTSWKPCSFVNVRCVYNSRNQYSLFINIPIPDSNKRHIIIIINP